MAGGKLWTEKEDRILTKFVRENFFDKEKAFLLCSQKIDRSATSCSNRWYQALSNPKHPKYKGVLFTMISSKVAILNRTHDGRKSQIVAFEDNSLWGRIKRLFKK